MADDTTTVSAAASVAPVEGVAAAPVQQVEALAAEADKSSEIIKVRDEEFRLAPEIPAIVMLKMTAAGDPKTPPAKQMSAIVQFLHYAIVPEDRDRFEALLEDAEPIIDFDELNTILEQATEVIAARPTEQ